MDDPIQDIREIVLHLTEGSPKQQEHAINTYFLPNASFTHPFCRTGSFEGSRLLIHGIFRWYKIMSPKIDLQVNGVAYDETNMVLYVDISQTFAIWFVPFHRSPVNLTTKLQLVHKPSNHSNSASNAIGSKGKYYIQSQNDLYQVDQFVRFFAPWGMGDAVVYLWHFWATAFCVILAMLFSPFTRLEDRWAEGRVSGVEKAVMQGVERIEEHRMHLGESVATTGRKAANGIQDTADGEVKKFVDHGAKGGNGENGQFGNMQVIT